MDLTLILSGIVALLLGLVYYKISRISAYWKDRGIPYKKPLPILGNAWSLVSLSRSLGEFLKDAYFSFPESPYVGIFLFMKPQLVVRDPQLIEKILVKDFNHFHSAGLEINEEKNWIDMNLSTLQGSKWRALRNKILPIFTTGKMKWMLSQMSECADNLVERLSESRGSPVDGKDVMVDYTCQLVGSCVFGLDVGKRPDSNFKAMGTKVLRWNLFKYFGFLVMLSEPKLAMKLNARFTSSDVADYFGRIILDAFQQRKKSGATRNDFVQLLLELKEQGFVEIPVVQDKDDDYLNITQEITKETFELSDKLLVAQAFVFLMAGFEAMSNLLVFLMYELSTNPECQDKVRSQIKEVLKRHDNQFSYQALKEMTYLDYCINETLRLHPLASMILRRCSKKYQLDENYLVEEGTPVLIPLMGLHMDPKYHPDPEQFYPERFNPETSTIQSFTYIPFGDGPRICIGMRFALLQMKLAVARVYDKFNVELDTVKTKLPLTTIKTSVVTMPKHQVWFKFRTI